MENVEALASSEGFDDDHHWYNHFGSDWKGEYQDCTYYSSSWSFAPTAFGFSLGSYNSSYHSLSGVCVAGDGNCWNGDGCRPL